MDALAELIMSARSLAARESDPPSLRNPHLIRALVASGTIILLPTEAAERWQSMFPDDLNHEGHGSEEPTIISPRVQAVINQPGDDPITMVVRRILADDNSGETMALFDVAHIKHVQIVGGPTVKNTYTQPESCTVLDTQTGNLAIRHRDPNATTDLARSYGLDG